MRRELPPKPHLEHLKAQAKDLLQAYRRGERAAYDRIRAAVPAFANHSDAELARGPFALHDAQSTIAREYGFPSWTALRTRVDAGEQPAPDPLATLVAGQPMSPELEA